MSAPRAKHDHASNCRINLILVRWILKVAYQFYNLYQNFLISVWIMLIYLCFEWLLTYCSCSTTMIFQIVKLANYFGLRFRKIFCFLLFKYQDFDRLFLWFIGFYGFYQIFFLILFANLNVYIMILFHKRKWKNGDSSFILVIE